MLINLNSLSLVPSFQAWKKSQSPMEKVTPRYKAQAAGEDLPKQAELPSLKICQVGEGNKLLLPRDIRSQFLQDPIWGNEWRTIVQNFDKEWGQPVADPATPSPGPRSGQPSPSPQQVLVAAKQEQYLKDDFQWASVFAGERRLWKPSKPSTLR